MTTTEQFNKDVQNHKMDVLVDNDQILSLRFAKPESWDMWFNITIIKGTNKNYAATIFTGDMGDYIFSRDFFTKRLDDYLFSQELKAGKENEFDYDESKLINWIEQGFEWSVSGDDDLICNAIGSDVLNELDPYVDSEADYLELIEEVREHMSGNGFEEAEIPPDMMKKTSHFLWCREAIRYAQQRYSEIEVQR